MVRGLGLSLYNKNPAKILVSLNAESKSKLMRSQINKLKKHFSTKAERRFLEMLKRNHISFKTKVKVGKHEVDFLIGKYTVDLDGHPQDSSRNWDIINAGYSPIHYFNHEVPSPLIEEWLKQIQCQEQV